MAKTTYGKYTCVFEDSQDEDGDHAFATITFPGDVNVPNEVLVAMVLAADHCGVDHQWDVMETHQLTDDGREALGYEWETIQETKYYLHRNN